MPIVVATPQVPTFACAPWAAVDDVCAPCNADGFDQAILTRCLSAATDVLFQLSGRQFSGQCVETVRPCAKSVATDHGRPIRGSWPWGSGVGYWSGPAWQGATSAWGWCLCNRTERAGCYSVPEVALPGYPVTQVMVVKVDGVELTNGVDYRVDDDRFLVRLPDPDTGERRGWPCFPAGTLVLSDSGLKPIEMIAPGEYVLTHRNRWRRVLRSGRTGESVLVTVRGRGGSIRCTPDHQFLAADVFGKPGQFKLGGSDWVQAKNLIDHAWAIPTGAEPLDVPLPVGWADTAEFWWIVGRYIADGHLQKRTGRRGGGWSVYLNIGRHKAEEVAGRLGPTWRRYEQRTSVRFRRADEELHKFLATHFGKLAVGKRLPAWLLGAPEPTRRAVLQGYLDGDGYRYESHGTQYVSARTISRNLAIGLKLIGASLGYAPRYYDAPQTTTEIEGRPVNGQHTYRVEWPENPQQRQFWTDNTHIWGRVRAVELHDEEVDVYDLEVDEDHSFVADGFVVHNCCSDVTLPDTEPGTFSVQYKFGNAPPVSGVLACAELGCQLALALSPQAAGECKLPKRVTSLTRQGMTAVVLDPMAFLDKGKTGLYDVDLFLASSNKAGIQRRATAWHPEMGRRTSRRTGTA